MAAWCSGRSVGREMQEVKGSGPACISPKGRTKQGDEPKHSHSRQVISKQGASR